MIYGVRERVGVKGRNRAKMFLEIKMNTHNTHAHTFRTNFVLLKEDEEQNGLK